MAPQTLSMRLVGATGSKRDATRRTSPAESNSGSDASSNHQPHIQSKQDSGEAIFRSAQWSGDGTTILTNSADNTLRSFILPPDLLSGASPRPLTPYSTHTLPSPAYANPIHPSYTLSNPATCLFLTAPAHLPIRLLSPFNPSLLASYPLVNPQTEAYTTPHALLFSSRDPNSFLAGADRQIALFDLGRDGEVPVRVMQTAPGRRKKGGGGGSGMTGIVSALGTSSEGILAAGTFTRWVGLYDSEGSGGEVGVFELGKGKGDANGESEGQGVTQVLWSECGRYLCVVERGSDGIGVWDVRGTGKRLCWLAGRKGRTMQRLAADLCGRDVWSGGTDGKVRVWEGVGTKEGWLEPDREMDAHEDCVSSAMIHPCGSVLATCSGQRHDLEAFPAETRVSGGTAGTEAGRETPLDNSLRIWNLESRELGPELDPD